MAGSLGSSKVWEYLSVLFLRQKGKVVHLNQCVLRVCDSNVLMYNVGDHLERDQWIME